MTLKAIEKNLRSPKSRVWKKACSDMNKWFNKELDAIDLKRKKESKTRKLLNGAKVRELDKEFTWNLGSKCPEKYLLIDCETGDLWVKNTPKGWLRPDKDLIASAKMAIRRWEKLQKEMA